ncbi:hypothetical protein ACTJ2Z_003499, partial [Vibrio vulnificus]
KSSNRDNQSQSENRENAQNKAKEKARESDEQGDAQRQKKSSEQGEEQVKSSDKPPQERAPKRETEPENVEAQQPAPKNADDPDFKKLESVENARDPAYLLKAQMLLQAQQKPAPDNKDKTW